MTPGRGADVPSLVIDAGTPSETVVTESVAILTYVAALAGPEAEAAVLGRDALQRGKTTELLAFAAGTIHGRGYAMLWRPLRFTDDEAAWDGVRAKARPVVEWAYGIVEDKLADRPAATGAADVGAADFYLYVFWRWGTELGVDMEGRFPRYGKLVRTVESIESVRKTLEAEKLVPSFS